MENRCFIKGLAGFFEIIELLRNRGNTANYAVAIASGSEPDKLLNEFAAEVLISFFKLG